MQDKEVPANSVPYRRQRGMMLFHDPEWDEYQNFVMSKIEEQDKDIGPTSVLVDAWDLYHTAVGIGRQALILKDSAWMLIAAVALRHVFEYMEYEPIFINLARNDGKKDVLSWVQKQWPSFSKLNLVANGTKHSRLKFNNLKSSFKRHETEEGYSSIHDLYTGTVDVSVSTVATFTAENGSAISVNVESILDDGYDIAYGLFEIHCPERMLLRPLPESSIPLS